MKNRRIAVIASALVVLALCAFVSISLGSLRLSWAEISAALSLSGEVTGNPAIVRDLRIPRVILAVLVGANLAVSGVLLQSVMGNPLADPGVIGISSGSAVVASIVLLYFPHLYFSLPFLAFLGASAACFVVYSLAWKKGLSPVRIILSGIAVNAVLGGVNAMLALLNIDNMQSILMWMNGSMSVKGWKDVNLLLGYSVFGLTGAMLLYKSCDIIVFGDKTAQNLGVNPNTQRMIISGAAVYLAGVSTAVVGIIGFVGLIVPHIARLLIGSGHRYLLPFSAVAGAMLLLLADTAGRVVLSPYEIPVGVVTAVLGGPFFLYLLKRSDRS